MTAKTNTKTNTKTAKRRKTAKKTIRFHPNAKTHNGENNADLNFKVYYNTAHVFPYIENSNLTKANLWSTLKNLQNARNNARLSLMNDRRKNEEPYLRKHKRLPESHQHLAAWTPAEFAQKKAEWIASNVQKI